LRRLASASSTTPLSNLTSSLTELLSNPAYVSIRQHTSAHVSTRQHTSAFGSIRQHTSAYVSIRQHTAQLRQHTSAYVSIRHTYLSIRRIRTSSYVSIRPHTSAYISIRQDKLGYVRRWRTWRGCCRRPQRSFQHHPLKPHLKAAKLQARKPNETHTRAPSRQCAARLALSLCQPY